MFATLRRSYATIIPDPVAAAARTASAPLAVRLRRSRKAPTPSPTETDARPSGLTPSEFARYTRLKAKGDLIRLDGTEPTEEQWAASLVRRARLRGLKHSKYTDGTEATSVVAQKVYLPQIVLRMVRNHTPAGQAYNPYEATFRMPQSVTKTDIRSYLHSVYGVKTTYIRTANYVSPLYTDRWTRKQVTRPEKTYKRAVVGLVEPFYYPQAKEDMSAEERETREEWLEQALHVQEGKDAEKRNLLLMTRSSAGAGGRWRGDLTVKRSTILQTIADRRALREKLIAETKSKMQESRKGTVRSAEA